MHNLTPTYSQTISEPQLPQFGNTVSLMKENFKKQKFDSGLGGSKRSELKIYLSEAIVEDERTFDILRWWKLNSERFLILSRMAKDVLVVPISTMASESCFNTSSRVLDIFQSSLTPKIVEALIYSQDWLRIPS